MKIQSRIQSEKGQSLLELALVLVFVLILLAGVIDLGRMMYEYLTMRDAAQEGAGYGAVYPNDCDHIVARVMQNLPDANYTVGINIEGLSCQDASNYDYGGRTLPPYYGCAGHTLTIIIDHTTQITMPFISAFTGTSIPMHVEIDDRIVRPECSTVPNP